MNKDTCSFEEWHRALCKVAEAHDGSAADADAWFSDYEEGKTPEQAWSDEWG